MTKIEWAEEVWNPITGCSPISEGCQNCYAKRMATRLKGRFGYPKDEPFSVTFHQDKLDQPLKWKKPRMIFVCSMGDLFHKNVLIEHMVSILRTAIKTPQHKFLILTKRPSSMEFFFNFVVGQGVIPSIPPWIWLGISAENQQRADERIPILLQIPAAKRFVSIEPMLGPVDLRRIKNKGDEIDCLSGYVDENDGDGCFRRQYEKLDWVILGGESGPGARPVHPDWVRFARDQCQAARAPFFFKQWGEWHSNSGGYYNLKNVALFNKEQNEETPIYLRDLEPSRRDNWDEFFSGDTHMYKVGKKAAGRLLDGREWNERPER